MPRPNSLRSRFSRSPAAAAVLLAQRMPALPPADIAGEVLPPRPTAWPNLRVIELGDRLLRRRRELVDTASRTYRYRRAQLTLEDDDGGARSRSESARRLNGSAFSPSSRPVSLRVRCDLVAADFALRWAGITFLVPQIW